MSDKATIIREAQDFLEDAQKGVMKALNSEASFLSRLFTGSAKDSLKLAQSSISRALNQIANLREDESTTLGKLQKHLSERDQKIKNLEAQSEKQEQEKSSLNDRIRQLESKIKDFEGKSQEEQAAQAGREEEAQQESRKLEDNLKSTIEKLEGKNLFLTEKLDQNTKELRTSHDLILEFSTRLKKLKSEVTSR